MEQARKLAQQYMEGRQGTRRPPETITPAVEASRATQLLGSGEGAHEAAPGGVPAARGGGVSGLAGMAGNMASQWLGGGEATGDKQVASEGAAASGGMVDHLLELYQHSQGKQFEGQEHEYDQLAGLAQSALGTSIGRDVLKAWVRQRLGL